MQEEVELVENYCPEDCVYRSELRDDGTPCCCYAAIEGRSRGCRVSECDKYKRGRPKRPRIREEYVLFWEREIYDEDADIVW